MDDAMILPCGHSFGGGGMQHVIKMVNHEKKVIQFDLCIYLYLIPIVPLT